MADNRSQGAPTPIRRHGQHNRGLVRPVEGANMSLSIGVDVGGTKIAAGVVD